MKTEQNAFSMPKMMSQNDVPYHTKTENWYGMAWHKDQESYQAPVSYHTIPEMVWRDTGTRNLTLPHIEIYYNTRDLNTRPHHTHSHTLTP